MKLILKLEELAIALLCLYGLYLLKVDFWWYLLFLLGPDISFIGYSFGKVAGAYCYNIFHHKGIAVVVVAIGYLSNHPLLMIIGIVLMGRSSMDRFFGYGLKTFEGFKFTHLGKIGN